MGLVIDEQHFCQRCDKFVTVSLRKEFEVYPVNGEPTWVIANICHCNICGDAIWDNQLDSDNLNRAYRKFMKKHGLHSMDELRTFKVGCKMQVCGGPDKNLRNYESKCVEQAIADHIKPEQS